MKNLQLYKASAGSGKTYHLALNYIKELFSEPLAYRKILAVTFTNKAAAEMKKRILEKLFQLSIGDERAEGYAQYLLEAGMVKNEEDIPEKASYILHNILHNYSSFWVQTIDKFFLWIIKAFTREIGLQNGYNLEMDTSLVLAEAVDMLVFKMEEDEQLKSWLIKFAEDKINEGKSWDFYSDIFSLGSEVFKEEYQSVQDETKNIPERKEKFNSLMKKLNSSIRNFETSIRARGQKALDMIASRGLEISDFKGGKNSVANIFTKAVDKSPKNFTISATNRKGAGDFSCWVKKKDPNEKRIRELFDEGLNRLLIEILHVWDTQYTEYFTAIAIKNNIYSFGILNDISDLIREISREENLFLITDASIFLRKITGNNDTPFIFEKAGNYFSHYMLDEFQDTSRFQWSSFLPLVENGLSTGKNSVIVGDVKQSIYRWRNSDWKILAAELKESIPAARIEDLTLDTNYRSAKELVEFNNALFHAAPKIIKELILSHLHSSGIPEFEKYWLELIEKVYGEPRQKVFSKMEGESAYVSHKFYSPENRSEQIEQISSWLPERIMDLQNRNYNAGDITILVRNGREGREIARILMDRISAEDKYNFNVISNDSLYLAKNSAIRFLSALLNYFNQEYNRLNLTYIKHEYFSYLQESTEREVHWHAVFSAGELDEEDSMDENFRSFQKQFSALKQLPLYELTEKLIVIFDLHRDRERIAYIQAFQDVILDFIKKESSDLSAFLRYWENVSGSATLNISETQDAIRIMTIHKAKGLEFRAVIIPFCEWTLGPDVRGSKNITLWPATENTIFNEFGNLPVLYGKLMRESGFEKEYYDEMFRSFVDNLNLLYVAFTRAEFELHAFSRLSNEKAEVKNIGDLIFNIYSDRALKSDAAFPSIALNEFFDGESRTFSYGSPVLFNVKSSKECVDTQVLTRYPVTETTARLALNHKNIYLSDLKEDEKGYTGYGTQMHEIMAGIETKNDVGNALRNAWLKGLLNSREKENLEEEISRKISMEPLSGWFSGEWQCKLERDIVTEDGNILRPDRVMIKGKRAVVMDYKFGGEKRSGHKAQLGQYYNTLISAGYEVVELYLWYYLMDEIEEVMI